MNKRAYLFVIVGAALWGLIGVFVQALYSYGFSPLQVVAIRVLTAAILLIFYAGIHNPSALKIRIFDAKYFVATGLFSITFFNWCYFTVMKEESYSVAAILLYTAPAFVTIISRFVFKEKLTIRKFIALFVMFLGCSLVIGVLPVWEISISLRGLVIGLGSGLGYALYSIFGKLASSKYSVLTIITYTFFFASLAIIPISGLWRDIEILFNLKVLMYGFSLGLIPTVLAYGFYTIGLSRIESGRAALLANIELVVAALIGIGFFKESFTIWQFGGVFLVLGAIVLVQGEEKPKMVTRSLSDSL